MKRIAATLALLTGASCAELVQYTDELTDDRTSRTPVVTAPATLGGIVGFVVGIPVDVVLLPVTYPFYAIQERQDPARADWISVVLFPSFLLWRAGKLIATPLDLLEYGVYRAWLPAAGMTAEQRADIEFDDGPMLRKYPVEPLYPTPEWLVAPAAESGGPS